MKKITKLTEEQEASIPLFIDKWIDQASKPVDFLRARQPLYPRYCSDSDFSSGIWFGWFFKKGRGGEKCVIFSA